MSDIGSLIERVLSELRRKKARSSDSVTEILDILSDDIVDDLGDRAAEVIGKAKSLLLQLEIQVSKQNQPVAKMTSDLQNKTSSKRKPVDGVTAPFRFVSLRPEVHEPKQNSFDLNLPHPDNFDAVITVRWAAETPILIGEREQQADGVKGANNDVSASAPMRLGSRQDAPYCIPGSTIKGMLRSAIETIAFGRIGTHANLHHKYGIRDFNHLYYGQSNIMDASKVGAGFLKIINMGKDNEKWMLTPLGPEGWAHIDVREVRNLPSAPKAQGLTDVEWVNRSLIDKYKYIEGMTTVPDNGNKKGILIKFDKTIDTSGVSQEKIKGTNAVRRVVKIVSKDEKPRKGVLVFSGALKGSSAKKKREYIFFDRCPNEEQVEEVEIDRSIVEQFLLLHTTPGRNRSEPHGTFADLVATLKNNKRVPVFYVGNQEPNAQVESQFFFGFTRLFKIPHKYSVNEILDRGHPNHRVKPLLDGEQVVGIQTDYVERLFGYLYEPRDLGITENGVAPNVLGRRGRIGFSFAKTINTIELIVEQKPIEALMGAPRASFAPFYLRGPSELDHSADSSRVAGRKRYMPRKLIGPKSSEVMLPSDIGNLWDHHTRAVADENKGNMPSRKFFSGLKFLFGKQKSDGTYPEPLFESEIRLRNVTADEIGAVLFALTHGGDPTKPYRHMLGRSKAMGAGQVRVVSAALKVEAYRDETARKYINPLDDNDASWVQSNHTGKTYSSHAPFLDAFVIEMQKVDKNYPNIDVVREFLGASDPETVRGLGVLDYMMLKRFQVLRSTVNLARPAGNEPYKEPASGYPEQSPDGRILPAPKTTRVVGRPKNGA